MQNIPNPEFSLKDTKPRLGGQVTGNKHASAYDLVEEMLYFYVRVVKAKDLSGKDASDGCDPYVEAKLGNDEFTTRDNFEKKSNPEWNQVFAFSKKLFLSSELEVTVKDNPVKDDFIGRVLFVTDQIPLRVPPDSPLAPQWYRLKDRKGDKVRGELMLAVWKGSQADEMFTEAWKSDWKGVTETDGLANVRSKVYLSPRLWYLRVNVIEAQDLKPSDQEVFVKGILGNQALSTGISHSGTNGNPMWNEELMFVVAEPIEEPLILSVQDREDDVLGKCTIPLQYVDRRLDNTPVDAEWYTLENHAVAGSRIRAKICLEGGYHVLDESMHYSSDLRPAAKRLWNSSIGVLNLGILGAQNLMPMKMKDERGTTDAYCVAKYGQKWVRTRTIINSLKPMWNEQYSWEVFDPCTVITIGVFHNCLFIGRDKYGVAKDLSIGKVRIRLSTLETGRVYTHLYPLLVLNPDGVKKMGEIHLALRFTCSSLINMMHMYSQPLLPKMHYIHPLTVTRLDSLSLRHEATQSLSLRHQATQILSMRLSVVDPPLRKEVVAYMLDAGFQMWSLRRSKANFLRIMGIWSGLTVLRWFNDICYWRNPITTVLIHILFIILVVYPGLILPAIFLYLLLIGVWNYIWRPRDPPQVDTRFSQAEIVNPDELDEEFDTFPTSRPLDIVRMRYDRLRIVAGKVQTMIGDLAAQGERLQSLLTWRDPRATTLSVIFCLVAAIVFCVAFRVLVLLTGFYMLRHPRFRSRFPSVPLNFFRRLPATTNYLA